MLPSHQNIHIDDETTPPGTPPPPYKIKSKSSDAKHPMVPKRNHNFQSTNNQPCSNESVQNQPNAHNLSEHDDFMTGDSIFNTSTMSAASFGSSSGGGTGNSNIQRQIISMEDDELGDDAELISGKRIIYVFPRRFFFS